MKTETFTFPASGGTLLPAAIHLPETAPKLVLQVTHGMTEHFGRYTALAEFLTESGIAVAGFDLRGHGLNPGDPHCASFGDNGWAAALEDMRCFFSLLRERFPGLPHGMLGFSLGSFLLREYLGLYPDGIAGAAILGTGCPSRALLTVMLPVVKGQMKQAGMDSTTPLIRQLSFGVYNQRFKPNRTPSDWLCSDKEQLDVYRADPLCREDISAGLFWELLSSMKRTGGYRPCKSWNKSMPILLLSGEQDPVGNFGAGVKQLYRALEKAGLSQITMELLPHARHDLFHEETSGAAQKARTILRQWLLYRIEPTE